jgi:cytochrome c-type biogenesis protein CcmH
MTGGMWLFAILAVILAGGFGASLYWAGGRGQPGAPRGQSVALALVVPLAVAGLYVFRGTPQALNPAVSADAHSAAGVPDPKVMVQNLANRLKDHPEDQDGWLMLARSYMVLGRYADAAAAYEHAQDKVMQDSDALITWIELRLMQGDRRFDARTQELLDQAARLSPDHPEVMLLRALAAHDRGDKVASDALVSQLHERFPPGSKERQDIDKALDSWMGQSNAPATANAETPAPPAPPAGAAASDAPDPKAMVQRLADRLKDHPEDLDGWLMLARSYAVLGRYAEANDAFEHAQTRAMQDANALAIWVEMRFRMNDRKFDARTQELLGRAVALAPDDPDVLLLGALSAFGRGDKAGGDALVDKLHARFPAGTPERKTLDAALAHMMPPGVADKS